MAADSLASLEAGHVRRRRDRIASEPLRPLPVRTGWSADLRLFVTAWLIGFVAVLAFIA